MMQSGEQPDREHGLEKKLFISWWTRGRDRRESGGRWRKTELREGSKEKEERDKERI